jgi:transposase-like protein
MPATKTLSTRNPRLSPDQWRSIFNRFEKSGLTIKDFCHKENLAQATFSKWRSQIRQDSGPSGFIELQSSPDPSPTALTWSLQIDLPGGGHLCIQVGQ